jgi:N-acetyl sugar amidotransferase
MMQMYDRIKKPVTRYCNNCLYPSSSAVSLTFDERGVCSGCQASEEKNEINWDQRKELLLTICEKYRTKEYYDCVIPVSGGKDSYYQVHLAINELNLNPLLVTYNGNNFSQTGLKNVQNMREVFGVDHIWFTPAVKTLQKLNRLGMQVMGDMNWHNHVGLMTYPIRAAVDMKIPLMFWGEHGRIELGGMFSHHDFIEFTYKTRHEHDARGFEWYDLINKGKKFGENLSPRELIPWKYPSDNAIDEIGVRGLFVSNFFPWDANYHGKMVKEKYGFLEANVPFERTYRLMSNLDDIYENGIHDYMKFIKFGYGRASDHASKDIRSGLMSRSKGVEEVRARDHIKSKDLLVWLDYVGWNEQKFDQVADTFRDKRVWWIKNGEWWKNNLWGEASAYGPVYLPKDKWENYYVDDRNK